jgi:hypothetical protein
MRGMGRVTEVQMSYRSYSDGGAEVIQMSYAPSEFSGGTDDGSFIAWTLPQLHSLPAITSLTLDIPDALTSVAARALGSLTMLTTLELHRGDVESVLEVSDEQHYYEEVYYDSGGDGCSCGCCCGCCFEGNTMGEDMDEEIAELVAEKYMKLRGDMRVLAAQEDWSQALSPLKRLTTIDLSKCLNVTDKALRALTGLTKNLTTLKLSDGMVEAGYEHGLDVQHSITDEGIKAVCKLTSLSSLELAYTGVTDKGLLELRSLSALTSLALTQCDHVSAGAVKALTTALPNLTVT